MAVYGNVLLAQERSNFGSALDIGDFLSFVQETTYDINLMFEKAEMIHVLKEENTSLSIPKNFFEPEEAKKTLLQKVKEIISNFIAMVKKAFAKLAEIIHKKYMETNLQDKFISRYKDIVTFSNLEKARDNGWKGIPKTIPMINKIADIKDSKLYTEMTDDIFLTDENYVNVDRDIEPIISARSLDDAEKIYNEFVKKLEKFKSDSDRENTFSYISKNNMEATLKKSAKNSYFVISKTEREEDKYYFPIPEPFAKTKKLAEEGQSYIKQFRDSNQHFIKNIKMNKDVEMANLNSYKGSGSNVSEDKDNNKIMIMYYKARYKYTAAYVQRSTKVLNTVVNLIKMQYITAIQNYIHCVYAVKKYVNKEA